MIRACFLALALGLSTPAFSSDLPMRIPDAQWTPLSENRDAALQFELDALVAAKPTWAKLAKQKRLSVALVDISVPGEPRLASINGQKTVYAASLPKIAILLTAYDKIASGELEETAEVTADMNAMIRKSSNQAATRMIDRVGGLDAVNNTLKDPKYGLYDETEGGGLWVGKRYAKTGRRVADPVAGVSHGASAYQVARYYYLLANGRLVDETRSKQMMDVLVDPGISHKFVASLNNFAPDAKVYRKSGTWRTYHADSALVWGDEWRHYILVGVVDSPKGGQILMDLVPAVETLLKPESP